MNYPVRANGQMIGSLERSEIERRSVGWLKLGLPVEVAADGASGFVPLAAFLATAPAVARAPQVAPPRPPVGTPPVAPPVAPTSPMPSVAPMPTAAIYDAGFDLNTLSPAARRAYAAHTLRPFATVAAVLLGVLTANIFFVFYFLSKHGRLPKAAANDPSAGRAIGFLFIPFFNIYWIFFVWTRLVDRINLQLRLRSRPTRLTHGLPIAMIVVVFLGGLIGESGVFVWAVDWLVIVPIFAALMQREINSLAGTAAAAAAPIAPSSSNATYLVRVGGQQLGALTLSEIERRAKHWPPAMAVEVAAQGTTAYLPLQQFLQTAARTSQTPPSPQLQPVKRQPTPFWTPIKIGLAVGIPVLLLAGYFAAGLFGDRTAAYQQALELKQDGDYEGAAKGFAKAGIPDAEFNLALLYQNGQGVTEDRARALELLRSAADKGSAAAQTMLGVKYATGDGVTLDAAKAARWYEKAATSGYTWAAMMLGLAYAAGEGVPESPVDADKWFILASVMGDSNAAEERDRIEKQMNEDEIRRATNEANDLATAINKRSQS